MKNQAKRIVSIDIESLSLGPSCVITQIGMVSADMDDDEADVHSPRFLPLHTHLPIQPQLNLLPARQISADTLLWWMKQSDAARSEFSLNAGNDFDELPSLLRHFTRNFEQHIFGAEDSYEVWARGPQFDIAAIESLLSQCGITVPWAYNRVRDLRTLMSLANLSTEDVPPLAGHVPHNAVSDARFQLHCYRYAIRQLWAKD